MKWHLFFAIDKHLDRSLVVYANWKKVQENDVVRGMEVLSAQILQSITMQRERLESLQR